MPEDSQNPCIYCNNPKPVTNNITRRSIGYRLNLLVFSSSYEMDTAQSQPPRIICGDCGRDYYLMANSERRDYLENLLRSMNFSDTVLDYMTINRLDKGSITEGYIGISKPYSLLAPIKKKIYGDSFHIVFKADEITHFMTCLNATAGKIAINMEKIS